MLEVPTGETARGRPGRVVHPFRFAGPDSLAEWIRRTARRDILICCSNGSAGPLPAGWADVVRHLRVDVSVRVLSNTPLVSGPAGTTTSDRIASNWQLRLLPAAPIDVVVVDGEIALHGHPVEHASPHLGSTASPAPCTSLVSVLETLWLLAAPVRATRADVSDADRALLRMLASGATDEMIARSAHLSLRTVQRQVSILLTRLGATSRFQAGYAAAQQGWL